jgi:imidazolonepropionase-like amidohydrolase
MCRASATAGHTSTGSNGITTSRVPRSTQSGSRSILLTFTFSAATGTCLCGITRVQDHIPHFVREAFAKNMPIRIISDFAMAHSVTSFALKWGDGIEAEHAKAVKNNIPFITHCSEGYDEETLRSVETLAAKGALSKQTVLIHGIAFSDKDMDLLAEHQCNVVWCPVSNLYMFEQTARVKELMDRGINVTLGTDSPMSGSFSIFEEFRTAREFYRFAYGVRARRQGAHRHDDDERSTCDVPQLMREP